jgi:hypothetical protein
VLGRNEFTLITSDFNGAERSAPRRLRMRRFRLLGFYVVGVVALIGFAVSGVSLRRTAAGAERSQAWADAKNFSKERPVWACHSGSFVRRTSHRS